MRLKAYGIDFTHLELSDAALIAAVVRAEERKQPIVFFFYHPHWLFRRFDLLRLQEPNPYHAGCFEDDVGRCALPSFSAWIAARKIWPRALRGSMHCYRKSQSRSLTSRK